MSARVFAIGAAGIVLIALAGCQTCPSKGAVAPEPYACRLAAGPIAIDGKLDEAAWAKADAITEWHIFQPEGAECLFPSKVRLLWDKEFLYVAFEYEDIDIWSYSNEADSELWRGDVAELFIKPSRENPIYYEFVMAPNGTLYDGWYPSRGAGGYYRFKDWASNAKVATQVNGTDGDPSDDDQGYVVEVAFPMALFPDWAQPTPGMEWTFGAFRYDYSKAYDDPLLMMTIPEAAGHGYHSYEGYLPLRFEK
ncbi:MAG: carbohydrate-binding family 9-like protein [Candidatus Hydrogenedentes bacterium]|nr:carbohydrate-binding family 9-like protein [Candidatus Hydrogenedentota bacterium]